MQQRLVKVAKELNVGTDSIVDYLSKKGFAVEAKPTSMISEEMHNLLLQEFGSNIAIKEQANNMIIGARPVKAADVIAPVAHEPAKKEAPVAPPVAPPVEKPVQKSEVQEREKLKVKVVGKIDLTPKAPETKAKEEIPEEVTVPEVISEPVAPEVKPVEKEEDELIKAEAPQLQGLTILGKIDTDKFDSSKVKKEKEKEKERLAAKAKKDKESKPLASSDNSTQQKRKRKRKNVGGGTYESRPDPRTRPQTGATGTTSGGGGGTGTGVGARKGPVRHGGRDDVKEVSKKEIDDQIRATMARLSGGKSKRQKIRRESRRDKVDRQELLTSEVSDTKLQLTEFVSVSELASVMNQQVTDVIMTCMNLGVIVSINQRLDAEIIELVAGEFGFEVEFVSAEDQSYFEEEVIDDPADLKPRPPIVTVMGHVDHGKTSLLDYIRSANVVSGEAGGITQHIGAYEVEVKPGKSITFLDTPGHEAFTAMRARGAKITDIAVIIIAADDSIMPQTREAISHAQAAGVPIIFAINKIDKSGADPEKIKEELSRMNLLVEAWGGKIQSSDISAKTGLNVDELLEKILLEAELLDLKANPDRLAVGTVIEASLDKGRGYVTKLLVQTGNLAIGDIIVTGSFSGKVKAMFNERGKKVKEVGPSSPVLVLGLNGAPQAGEKFREYESEQDARSVAAYRGQINREQSNRANKRISLDEIGRRLALGSFKELNLIIKGDVDGSIEAMADSLEKLSIEKIKVNIIHQAVGQIVESDVLLASASDAIIIGFQVRPSVAARKLAEKEGVEIKMYSIIYEAINEIKAAIEGMLEPTKEEKILGQVEVREIFKVSKIGTVAGCIVSEGKIARNNHIRLIRDGIVIYPTKENVHGEIATLKRFKDDVKEVKAGLECGVIIKNFNDVKVGDVIEVYEINEIRQKLEN
ncbi:MAG TPA: translation initiation factor IF-2 [Saprospiraceae bacterium]|nr:translation initiation factor IF-2 [Saprospiraceae bacterium]